MDGQYKIKGDPFTIEQVTNKLYDKAKDQLTPLELKWYSLEEKYGDNYMMDADKQQVLVFMGG